MRFGWLIALALLVVVCHPAAAEPSGYTLYLVRHAEKVPDGSRNPALTGAGEVRAMRLADWLAGRKLEAIWSSDYTRTRETARPTAERSGLALRLYDPADLPGLARDLIEAGETALVVGHSNTTPELAALLCGCEVEKMPETEYDRLIRVTNEAGVIRLDTLSQGALPD